MTIIFQKGGEFWIEELEVTIGDMAAAANDETIVAFGRHGRYLGSCSSFRSATTGAEVSVNCSRTATLFTFGDVLQNLRISTTNIGAAQADDVRVSVMVFLRKA